MQIPNEELSFARLVIKKLILRNQIMKTPDHIENFKGNCV